jgi:hypothetical protein
VPPELEPPEPELLEPELLEPELLEPELLEPELEPLEPELPELEPPEPEPLELEPPASPWFPASSGDEESSLPPQPISVVMPIAPKAPTTSRREGARSSPMVNLRIGKNLHETGASAASPEKAAPRNQAGSRRPSRQGSRAYRSRVGANDPRLGGAVGRCSNDASGVAASGSDEESDMLESGVGETAVSVESHAIRVHTPGPRSGAK